MLGIFLTLLDKWGHPQPGKPSIPSRRPLSVQLLPWFYHGNSYWRDRANRNRPKVQERTLRHRSNELCRVVWRLHWPFMQKNLVRPQFATGFQKAPFGRRTTRRPSSFIEKEYEFCTISEHNRHINTQFFFCKLWNERKQTQCRWCSEGKQKAYMLRWSWPTTLCLPVRSAVLLRAFAGTRGCWRVLNCIANILYIMLCHNSTSGLTTQTSWQVYTHRGL